MEKLIIEENCQEIDFDGLVIITNPVTVEGDIKCLQLESRGDLYVGGDLHVGGDLYVGGDLRVRGYLDVEGYLNVGGNLRVRGYLDVGGNLRVRGNFYFNFYFFAKAITVESVLRLSLEDDKTERRYWSEKLTLFGFSELAGHIQTGCVLEIRKKVRPKREALLACPYWTEIERLVIISWCDGRVEATLGGDGEDGKTD